MSQTSALLEGKHTCPKCGQHKSFFTDTTYNYEWDEAENAYCYSEYDDPLLTCGNMDCLYSGEVSEFEKAKAAKLKQSLDAAAEAVAAKLSPEDRVAMMNRIQKAYPDLYDDLNRDRVTIEAAKRIFERRERAAEQKTREMNDL